MMATSFEGRVAVVTGAAQGIGFATAMQLARLGAKVVVADRAPEAAHAAVETIKEVGGDVMAAIYDLETQSGAAALVQTVLDRYGKIDVAAHNVGGTIWAKRFWEYVASEIEAEIRRSLWPTIWCCHAVLPCMISAGSGAIVNIGAATARGLNRVPYSTAKGGVSALTSALALELGTSGIRINCVAPGGVDVGVRPTPRNANLSEEDIRGFMEIGELAIRDTPMARLATPDEIASTVCFLASSEASYITGQTVYVAGGCND